MAKNFEQDCKRHTKLDQNSAVKEQFLSIGTFLYNFLNKYTVLLETSERENNKFLITQFTLPVWMILT